MTGKIIEKYDSVGGLWGRRIEAPEGPEWDFLRIMPVFDRSKSAGPLVEIIYTVAPPRRVNK
jgi:hypothetical protein